MLDQTVYLEDGRQLGFAQFGVPDGAPVIFNHGWPGSRLDAVLLDTAAQAARVNLVAVDRPGFGLSDFQPGRTLLDWPNDVAELADQLGLPQFGVSGMSGGGPFALACAHQLPDRVLGTALLAGVAPLSEPETKIGMRRLTQLLLTVGNPAPWLLRGFMWAYKRASRSRDAVARTLNDLPEVDQAVLHGELTDGLLRAFQEAFRQGIDGATHEGKLFGEWPFALADVNAPVDVWQGSLDVNVPVSNGKLQARLLPQGTLHLSAGDGHYSLIVNQGEAALRGIKARL